MRQLTNTYSVVMLFFLIICLFFWKEPHECKTIEDFRSYITSDKECVILARIYSPSSERFIHISTQDTTILPNDITLNDVHLTDLYLYENCNNCDIYNNDEYIVLFKDDKLYLTSYKSLADYSKDLNSFVQCVAFICLILFIAYIIFAFKNS